jgi:hypothetical protein
MRLLVIWAAAVLIALAHSSRPPFTNLYAGLPGPFVQVAGAPGPPVQGSASP